MIGTLRRLQLRARLQRGDSAQGSYWRSVLTLTSGSMVSQAIGIASMLAVARLYAPADFGAFALFLAYSGLLALIATAKYDAAVFMARRAQEAADLAMLGTVIAVAIGGVILVLSPLLGFTAAGITAHPIAFFCLLALAAASGGAMTAMTAWAMQLQQFAAVTQGRMVQSLVTALLSMGLGFAHWREMGLILGLVAGQVAICGVLGQRLGLIGQLRHLTWRKISTRARRNIRFPKFLLAGEALNYVGNNAISFYTPALFGPAALGQFNLGQRVAAIPINIIGTSMAGVFRSAVSPQHIGDADIAQLFRSGFVRLSAVGAVLTLPLLLLGPQLFEIAFGARWHDAGFYVQILSPVIFARFVASPLSVVLLLANRQNLDTIMQLLFVVAAFTAAGVGAWFGSFLYTVVLFTGLQTAIYGLYLVTSYRLAKGMSTQ